MGASTMRTAKTTTGVYSEASRPRLSPGSPRTTVWNRNLGFKVPPEAEALPLYPALDFKRFFQSSPEATLLATSDNSPPKMAQPPQPSEPRTMAPLEQSHTSQPVRAAVAGTRVIVEKAAAATYTAPAQPAVDQPALSAQESHPTAVEPPRTSLDFNISHDLFQAALREPKDSPGSFWSHTMYKRAADGATHNVKVHYCTSRHTMQHVCQRYFADEPVLGFDLEWLAYARRGDGPRANVSLIQIASPSRIGLFHVALFPRDNDDSDLVAPAFRALVEDPAVLKVGVHIQADCTRLRTFLGVAARGVLELSHLYKLVKYARDAQRRKLINKVPVALATQVQEVLKLPLFKGQSVRSSNWSVPLTSKQLTYSAADAYAGLQLYHVLEERRLAMDPPPEPPRYAELGFPIPIPSTPVVSDIESDVDSDPESVEDAGSECSDGSIEAAMQELASAETLPTTTQSTPALTAHAPTSVRDARVKAAEAELAQLRAAHPGRRLRATPSSLRAFYVWQANDDLTPADVARLLRDPPLQTSTVLGYIMDAILAEKLAFPKQRLQTQVLSLLHPTLANGKYRAVVKQCEQAQT
ncbi:3 -5 exonuclease helicase (Wrn) [Cordyceps militaris]|uniref:3-5 exonuclease helicase (Wrn) n=1 Tax=Cordyceps militaris TaxID=73501 RepID=A0A2H4S9T8_CORMI|nr:3 -5 exonuclease helicase (Wrn) [Cordyceps militaris]